MSKKFKEFWKSEVAVAKDNIFESPEQTIRRIRNTPYDPRYDDDDKDDKDEKDTKKTPVKKSEGSHLISIDNQIWDKLGFNHGGDVDKNWDKYLAEVRNKVSGSVSKEAFDQLEDENHHSMCQALHDLGKVHK